MSFSFNVKNEISKIVESKECCSFAELSALIKMTGTILLGDNNGIGIRLSTENAAIARRMFILLKNLFNIQTKVMMRKNRQLKKNNTYTLMVDSKENPKAVLVNLQILDKGPNGYSINQRIPGDMIKKECCKRAYLRGVFLGGGSISHPERTYHLEIVANNKEYAEDIRDLINTYDLNAKIVLRKKSYVVYLKEGESLADFLKVIGAHNALLNFENVRIYKEMRNNVNRIVNCETANLSKTVNAAIRQINNIEYIKRKIGLNKLPKGLRDVAEVRLLHRDASLKELGELLNPPVGKSGVNHRLRKLERIAEDMRNRETKDH